MRQMTLTLPDELADLIDEKVASGAYPSGSDVVRQGLELLREQDETLEDWLRREVVPAYDAMKADPSRALAIDDVQRSLTELHRALVKSA
ncbi:ribbon-helix-helix domain-containing protein [Enterovirga rhinocerotis]|uniref:Putative addiction module CopG family antidote n=1 Tax=Enterovirga rhinocerotis TaxID=1339210 RepID=A0A4R7BYZ6_9HYPH|nr:type II toxin-antitoxin system ParD family antitoxin [Enterovirga rhinocerotis]TDR89276.1 putative addiction module CopG family antidote [Enterovirga rhinocerotis]